MSCSGCANTVQQALNNIDGVTNAKGQSWEWVCIGYV
ncbi:heavy-metal-associated domain-containing protein [Fodinibius salsisoli]|uniref:Heavy-metal-associated domain-containing protein n=1 Tax=Fodinibius salsisoli TaxID=2820877 RepID=A0ABT3PJU7_9BACT|nr:heavy-metal-associated domain-containing protein [Fodinibius salsisoli]